VMTVDLQFKTVRSMSLEGQKATCLQRHGRNGSAEPVLRLAEGKAWGSIRATHEKHNGRSLVPAQAGRRQ